MKSLKIFFNKLFNKNLPKEIPVQNEEIKNKFCIRCGVEFCTEECICYARCFGGILCFGCFFKGWVK